MFGVSPNYEDYISNVIECIDDLSPLNHLKKYQIIKGDAQKTIPKYMEENPETLVSLAILDFDIYKPTKTALESIKNRISKGSILVFDELADNIFPGETIALREVFEIKNLKINRMPFASRVSYIEF